PGFVEKRRIAVRRQGSAKTQAEKRQSDEPAEQGEHDVQKDRTAGGWIHAFRGPVDPAYLGRRGGKSQAYQEEPREERSPPHPGAEEIVRERHADGAGVRGQKNAQLGPGASGGLREMVEPRKEDALEKCDGDSCSEFPPHDVTTPRIEEGPFI